jgi:hypothetical protein
MRTNLVQNPKFQNNADFWSLDSEFTATTGSGGALSGGYVRQQSPSGGFQNFTTVNDANGYAVAQNTDYVFSFYYKIDSLTGNGPLVQINGTSAFGTTLGFTSLGSTGGAWFRADIEFNSGAHSMVYMRLFNNNGNVDASYSNFMLEVDDGSGDPGAYFDGDSSQSGYSYAWTGSANASTSTETQLFTTYTKTFTADGIVKVLSATATFTADAIIENPDENLPENFLIYELMDVEPSGTLIDDATYQPGYVRLTEAVNSQDGQLEYLRSLPSAFAIEADLYANGQADASYIYWGHSTTPESEDGGDGYIVALDEYTGDGDGSTIELRFNGVELTQVVFPHNLGGGEQRAVKVIYDNTQIKVYVDDVLCIDYDDIARILPGTRIGVGARTGGANAEHRCYKLTAYNITSPWRPTAIAHGLHDLPIRSIDTMKWQKDLINNQPTVAKIRAVVKALAENFDLTHIAIAIPFNIEQDYLDSGIVPGPYMSIDSLFQVWCDVIHEYGLGVIFRGAFNETEVSGGSGNWNSVLRVGVNRLDEGNASSALTDGQNSYLGRLHDFIIGHPSYFQDGDIFAPMPERTENNTFNRTITSITRSGQIATVTCSSNIDVNDGQPVKISGADQSEYNGSFIINKTADNQFEITVTGSPATPATGSPVMTFGVSVFSDETSWITAEGSGVTTNFANFFNEMITMANAAFSQIGKNVLTGYSSNNYSEIDSGWIPQSLFDGAQKIVADHYGSTHTPFEMYNDVVSAVNSKGYSFYHQEWADYWNGSEDDDTREDYLINFYNMLTQLKREGDYKMLNYWGGWVFGVGEGILTSTGTEAEPAFDITWWGDILASYFNGEEEAPPTGVHGEFGYFLNDVELKAPTSISREYIHQKTDYTTITGKTVRDTSSIKEKYILKFDNLSKAQVDAMMAIVELNRAVQFEANVKDIVNINKMCFPYIGSINYDTLGSNYLSDLELELIVEEAD